MSYEDIREVRMTPTDIVGRGIASTKALGQV
jgi:hypothetical protein